MKENIRICIHIHNYMYMYVAPLYMGILQARILKWVAISSSRIYIYMYILCSCSVMSNSLQPHGL